MKLLNLLIVFLFFGLTTTAQRFDGENDATCKHHLDTLTHQEVYTIVQTSPVPEGGYAKLYKEIVDNINLQKTVRLGVESKIYVGFIVNADGSIKGKRVLKNIEGSDLSEQALDIIGNTPWSPGYCDNEPVPVIIMIPIQLCLG